MPGEVRDGQGGPGEGCGLWALNSRFWILGPVLWALGSGLWFWTVVLGSGLLALGSGSGFGLQNLGSRLWALGSGLLALSPGLQILGILVRALAKNSQLFLSQPTFPFLYSNLGLGQDLICCEF